MLKGVRKVGEGLVSSLVCSSESRSRFRSSRVLVDRDGGSPVLVITQRSLLVHPIPLYLGYRACSVFLTGSVQLAFSIKYKSPSRKQPVWRNAACLGKLWVGSGLCAMGPGGASMAGGGNGDTAAAPP